MKTVCTSILFCIINIGVLVAQHQPHAIYDDDYAKQLANEGQMPTRYVYLKYPNFDLLIDDYAVWEGAVNYTSKQSYCNNKTVAPFVVSDGVYCLKPLTAKVELNETQCENINKKQIALFVSPLVPAPKEIHFKVSASLEQSIKELPPSLDGIDIIDWYKTHSLWVGKTDFVQLKDSNHCFQIPLISSIDHRDEIYQQLQLKDTTVVLQSTDYSYVGDVVYKGKIGTFSTDYVILKIDMYRKDTLVETKYIRIFLSHGC